MKGGARLGLVAFGFAIALLATEALLQVLAASMRIRSDAPIFLGGPIRVICLGDSNTYGLYVPRAQAWPQQLEALWMADPHHRPIQVVNLGYPGMNSSRVRNQLPSILEALHPDLVLLMLGANDFWTLPEATRDTPATLGMLAWRYSRVYRLIYMLSRVKRAQVAVSGSMDASRGPDEVSPELLEQGVGVARGEGLELPLDWQRSNKEAAAGWIERLDANLTAIATLARDAGTTLVFVTYPSNRWSMYGAVNERLRAAAEATHTPLIDLGQKFDAACPKPCPDLFFRDQHPTVSGYTRAAQELMEELNRQPNLLTPSVER